VNSVSDLEDETPLPRIKHGSKDENASTSNQPLTSKEPSAVSPSKLPPAPGVVPKGAFKMTEINQQMEFVDVDDIDRYSGKTAL
jgi:hypothetical protein